MTQGRHNIVKPVKDEMEEEELSFVIFSFSIQFSNQQQVPKEKRETQEKSELNKEGCTQGKETMNSKQREGERGREKTSTMFQSAMAMTKAGKISPDCHVTFPVVISSWRPSIRA